MNRSRNIPGNIPRNRSGNLFNLLRVTAICIGAVASLAISAQTTQNQQPQYLDGVAVIVNNDVVLETELLAAAEASLNPGVSFAQLPPEQRRLLLDQVSKRIILDNALLQQARERGIFVSDEELHTAMTGVASEQGLTLTQLRSQMESTGTDFLDFQLRVSESLTVQKLQQNLVQARVNITLEDVEQFLSSKEGELVNDLQYLLHYIVLDASSADSTSTAETIVTALRDGESIEPLARAHSIAPNSTLGGASDWRSIADVPSALSAAVRWASKGEILGPIEHRDRLFIARVTDVRGQSFGEELEYTLQHIMVKPNVTRSSEQATILLNDLRHQLLEEDANFEDLALNYSEDAGTKHIGGKLGKTQAESLPPEFAANIKNLDIGAITEPFSTEEGIHIVKINNIRTVDKTVDNLRSRAVNVIYQRKFSEELQRLISNQREDAFVRYLPKPDLEQEPSSAQ